MWLRLCVDVRPDGEVIGLSYEIHDDDGVLSGISTLGPFDGRSQTLGDSVETVWKVATARLGLLPLRHPPRRLRSSTTPPVE